MINTSSVPAVAISLWTLGAFSFLTWALIFVKGAQNLRVAARDRRYAARFWAAANLQAASEITATEAPLGRVATAGFQVLRQDGGQPQGAAAANDGERDLEHSWDRQELLERNLRQQISRERRGLEAGLALLATVGSTAPFVGLFGTVWGIMNAMHDISKIGNASIDVVAGPIGAALVATGIGIATAVPAVLAYNYFLRRVKAVVANWDDFAHDFFNLAQRATYRIAHEVRPDDVRSVIGVVRRQRTGSAPHASEQRELHVAGAQHRDAAHRESGRHEAERLHGAAALVGGGIAIAGAEQG